jgi:hypothetical protein
MFGNDRVEDRTGKLVWVFRHAPNINTADLGGRKIFRVSNTTLGHYQSVCLLRGYLTGTLYFALLQNPSSRTSEA